MEIHNDIICNLLLAAFRYAYYCSHDYKSAGIIYHKLKEEMNLDMDEYLSFQYNIYDNT